MTDSSLLTDNVSSFTCLTVRAHAFVPVGDPWRESTVSADGVDVPSTEEQPIAVGDGFHCSDLISDNGAVDPTVLAVQTKGLAFMATWLAEWTPPSSKRDAPQSRTVGVSNSRLFRA